MSEMHKFHIEQQVKDRYNYIFKSNEKFATLNNSLDEAAPVIANIYIRFEELTENKDKHNLNYLFDVIAYYVMLYKEIHKLNEQLIYYAQELQDKLDE